LFWKELIWPRVFSGSGNSLPGEGLPNIMRFFMLALDFLCVDSEMVLTSIGWKALPSRIDSLSWLILLFELMRYPVDLPTADLRDSLPKVTGLVTAEGAWRCSAVF